MAHISYERLWGREFYNNVSPKDRVQDININQLKLKINDTYKKDKKLKKNFEPSDDPDVINKAYLDDKLSKLQSHIS